MRLLNPKNDLVFRKIFGNENKKEILISFLNSVLYFTYLRTITESSFNKWGLCYNASRHLITKQE